MSKLISWHYSVLLLEQEERTDTYGFRHCAGKLNAGYETTQCLPLPLGSLRVDGEHAQWEDKICYISALEVQGADGTWEGFNWGRVSKKWELNRGLKYYAEMALRLEAAKGSSAWILIFLYSLWNVLRLFL